MEFFWIFLHILSWGSLAGVLHTYVLYPLILRSLASGMTSHEPAYKPEERSLLPRVSILMSAFNEARVLPEKLESLDRLDYPFEKMTLYAGSDHSSDGTDQILEAFESSRPWAVFVPFTERQGKPAIINQLAARAIRDHGAGQGHLLLITDANIILHPMALFHLARHFCDPQIGVVDSHILPYGLKEEGISKAEQRYLSTEVRLKHWEGLLWGAMIGPFGGCYALRSDYFNPAPANFLVDDFYLTMKVLEAGGKAVNDLEAVCYEGATHAVEVEFRRKKRIGAGNFQNMKVFRKLWWPPFTGPRFAFFSHKVLRWITPHLVLTGSLSVALLAFAGNQFYQILLVVLGVGMFLLPLLDVLLVRMGVQVLILRGIRYFWMMNLALFSGWIYYLKGIRTNVWQPTQRN
ncbi:MAG: glycosyltransferase [Haliscomenobacter sp.]|nr:glycosyltransferase [Haliscomenobacter sp.]MBK7474516.1 glycosyltransferase [Haliscomenobacter sp.]